MKTLPRFFIIKRDDNNPLWRKYIDWLNQNSDSSFIYGNVGYYYGLQERVIRCIKDQDLSMFPIITIEEWDECVNGVKQEESRGYFTFQNWTL